MVPIKICYAAIFKNESKNVFRCLNSIKTIIDYVCICDTGSTDNTVELIYEWGKKNDIPTKVHHGEDQIFKNFGYNRTLSYLKAIESFPRADYLLLIDADMVIKIEPSFKNLQLNADSYMFEQVTPGIRYWNMRMISTKCKWECVGVTHEYWECKKEHALQYKTKDIWINDIGDGGSKENKFRRDIKLLTEGIADPNTKESLKGRYKFYLANSYKDLNEATTAVMWYQKTIEHGGWVEEMFYSYFNMGHCYISLGDKAKATEAYMLAWEKRPTRAESLYHLAKMYRLQGHNNIALLYALKGFQIPYPEHDSLFIDYNVYTYLFLEEISIAGFYCEDGKQKGKACILKLLSMKDKIPADTYNLALSNAKHYGISTELLAKMS